MGSTEKRFCGFCRSERNVYVKKHVFIQDFIWAGAMAFLLMFILWQSFDPRAIVIFATLVGLTEVVVQIRSRMALSCPYCGFDPILYSRNKTAAAERVKEHLE